jgi:hypothetical protein
MYLLLISPSFLFIFFFFGGGGLSYNETIDPATIFDLEEEKNEYRSGISVLPVRVSAVHFEAANWYSKKSQICLSITFPRNKGFIDHLICKVWWEYSVMGFPLVAEVNKWFDCR